MNLFRFDASVGHSMERYHSKHLTLTRIIPATRGEISVVFMHVAPDGVVGYHQARDKQLFMVVAGEGWVTGQDRQPVEITSGQAALWEAGEWHESGSAFGMQVMVLEGNEMVPEGFLSPL